jgi:hypothetical protein
MLHYWPTTRPHSPRTNASPHHQHSAPTLQLRSLRTYLNDQSMLASRSLPPAMARDCPLSAPCTSVESPVDVRPADSGHQSFDVPGRSGHSHKKLVPSLTGALQEEVLCADQHLAGAASLCIQGRQQSPHAGRHAPGDALQRLDEGGSPQRHPLALRHLPQPRKRLQRRGADRFGTARFVKCCCARRGVLHLVATPGSSASGPLAIHTDARLLAGLDMGCRTSVMTLSRRRFTSTSSHRKFCRFCGGGGRKLLRCAAEL